MQLRINLFTRKSSTYFIVLLLINLSCKSSINETHQINSLNRHDTFQSALKSDQIIVDDTISQTNADINSEDHKYIKQLNTYPFISEDSITGIGIVSIDGPISIYDQNGYVLIKVEVSEKGGTTYVGKYKYESHDTLNPFQPRLYVPNPDYYRLALDCIKKDSANYEVIINKHTGQTGIIRKKPNIKFETIDSFVNNWTGLGFDFDRANNPLRKTTSLQSDTIHNNLVCQYSIWSGNKIRMKGDWMEIRVSETETGWIKWREGNQILIRMYFAC